MKRILISALALALSLVAFTAQAQVTTGVVKGVVVDQNGAVVPNASVTITNKVNNQSQTAQTSDNGAFEFSGLLVGQVYTMTVEAQGFKKAEVTDVQARLGQTVDLSIALTAGQVTEQVVVTAAGAELVDTTTANLAKGFNERQVVELAQTGIAAGGLAVGAGVNNLALIAPNVSSAGGVGVGFGASVGGQRPRNNNFMLDGIDNNDKSVTGPQSYVSPEEVAEFTLLQNQFSAEFGRSTGGQFLTVTKSGTNDYHGALYGFFRNRYLNALDNLQKTAGVTRNRADGANFMSRQDNFRGGLNLGGPVILPKFGEGGPSTWKGTDKLWFFFSYERLQNGSSAPPGGITAPTAAGFATLGTIPGLSATNLNALRTFLPSAPINDAGTIVVLGRVIPIGSINFPAPNFFKQNHIVANVDYSHSNATQMHFRFTMTNGSGIDTAAALPVFYAPIPNKQRLFSWTTLHTFSSTLTNETRLAFRRSSASFPVPAITYPGLTVFPNITLDDLGVNIGPDQNAPQFGIENNYQIVDNLTWTRGNHAFRFGGDFRWLIAPQSFSQRVRGDYEYGTTAQFLADLSPDVFGERNAGNNIYYGNQKVLYAYAQDDWRVRPSFTLNLGLSYSYQQVPLGARTGQALNAISSVPGLIEFRSPTAQTKNFAPKFGFAWSPNFSDGLLGRVFGSTGKSAIRGGFSMAYDYIFDNLYILSNPPQLQQTNDVDTTVPSTPNFLASGGLPDTPVPLTDVATARAQTASFIPDQKVPYALTYTLSFQRQFLDDWSFEVRALHTRGIHQLTQNRLNRQAKVAPYAGRAGLPTFITAPSQAQIDALTLTLDQINARSSFVPAYEAAGFNQTNLVAFLSNGTTRYWGGSVQIQKRFAKGLQWTNAYTWSHLTDDSTAEVFSTVLSPRRQEDFQDLARDRADSALDRRHRFVSSWVYDLPWFRDAKGWTGRLLGGFSIAGTYTAESGEGVTIRSGNDANLNGDNAGDRAILNTAGQEGVGSLVNPLLRSCPAPCALTLAQRTVGYVAVNPNAKYIQTGDGAVSTIGRNTFRMPGISNFDISVFKNFRIGEGSKRVQLRADFFNAFNHPQYVPGSVNTVDPIDTSGVQTLNTVFPLTLDFARPDRVFSSNPRVIQVSGKFIF